MTDDDEPSITPLGPTHLGDCGKACYPGRASAIRAMRHLQRHGKSRTHEGRLHVYHCRECGAWHVGHTHRGER